MKIPRTLAFLLLLTLVPVTMIPVASAATWTTVTLGGFDNIDTSFTPDPLDAEVLGSKIYILKSEPRSFSVDRDVVFHRRTVSGTTYGSGFTTTVTTQSVTTNKIDIDVVSTSELVVCYVAGGDLYFQKSTNDGALWSTPLAVDTTAVIQGGCEIHVFGTAYVIVYSNDQPDLVFRRSTDGGLTWGAMTVLDGQDGADEAIIAAKDANNGLIAHIERTADVLRTCKTTDGGATWTNCATVAGTSSVASVDLEYVSGNRWDMAAQQGTVTTYFTTNDFGALWSQAAITGTATNGDIGINVDPTDSTRISVFTAEAVGTTTTPLKNHLSSDGGATWSDENVRTFGVAMQMPHISAVVDPNGNSGVVYEACTVEGTSTDIDCSGGTASTNRDVVAQISYTSFADVAGSLTADDTIALTDVNGFNMEPTGQHAITRTGDGKYIEFVALADMSVLNTPINTNCELDPAGDIPGNKDDGVMMMYGGNLGAFLNCNDQGDPDFLSIRETDGSIPDAADYADQDGEQCTPGDNACPYDINISSAGNAYAEPCDSATDNIGQIGRFPISFGNNEAENGVLFGAGDGPDRRQVAWGFTTRAPDAGKIGIGAFTGRTGATNSEQCVAVPFSAGSEIVDFCIGLDTDEYYLAGVNGGSQTRVYPIAFDTSTGDQGILTPTIGSAQTVAGTSSGAGIACGGGKVLVMREGAALSGEVWYAGRTASNIIKLATVTSSIARGVALSEMVYEQDPDGTGPLEEGDNCGGATVTFCIQYGAYLDYQPLATSTIYVFDAFNSTANNPDITCTITFTGATYFDMELERAGNFMVVAHTNRLDKYNLQEHDCTTDSPVGHRDEDPTDDPTDDDEELTEGILNLGGVRAGTAIGNALGIGAFGGNLVLAGMTILGMTVTGATVLGGMAAFRSLPLIVIGAGIGVIVGFLCAWGFGFLNDAAVFATIVLGVLVVIVGGAFAFKRG